MNTISIAEAKSHFSKLIHRTAQGEVLHLSRHGKTVAVLLSEAEYQNLLHQKKEPWKAIAQWREETNLDELDSWDDTEMKCWRQEEAGRSFSWED